MSGRRQRSALWEHFEKISDEVVVCGHCGEQVKKGGGTSNMKKHLERRHLTRLGQIKSSSPPTQDIDDHPWALAHQASYAGPSTSGTQPRLGKHFQKTLLSFAPGRSLTTMTGLPAPEDHGSSEFGHNNGDEVPVAVSPEQFLAETSERELTPAPPTPTPQKPESYQLRHNNHLTIVLEALARDESFMDVTLTAQGRSLKAHKSVLSAVSPYFRGVLRDNPCQHPIIIMPRDVRFEELFSIVNYIYKGEMTVAAEDLTSLLKTAEILQVSGLAPSDSSATVNPHTDSSTAGNARSSSASSSSSSSNLPSVSRTPRVSKVSAQQSTTPPPRPRSRDSTINPTDFMDVDMTCVKEEVPSGGEEENEEQITKESSSQPPGSGIKDQTLQQSLPTFSPSYDPSLEQPSGSTCASQNIGSTTMAIKSDPEAEVNSQMTVATENPQPFLCPHCQEQHRDMDTMITHLRVKHPTKPSFTCRCGRIFTRQINHQAHARICSSSS